MTAWYKDLYQPPEKFAHLRRHRPAECENDWVQLDMTRKQADMLSARIHAAEAAAGLEAPRAETQRIFLEAGSSDEDSI
jgi:hypothetical protein